LKYRIRITESAVNRAESMSLRELLYNVCCPDYGILEGQEILDTASAFIHAGNSDFHAEMTRRIKEACSSAPLITTDLEAGPGSMIKDGTQFPSLYSCSVAGDSGFAHNMGEIAGLEGKKLGYNWTLGPAVDICVNPDTPTTGSRGAGSTVSEAIEYGNAYISGCQKTGMIATAKHFPGDGFGIYDQHLTTPEIPLTMEEWWKTSGTVYREVIKTGVMSIMIGHLSFPAYDEEDSFNGEYPPATLSRRLINNLLIGELGFEGLIISDAVQMAGFSGFMNYYEACARFLEAGGDVLLFAYPDSQFIERMRLLMEAGKLHRKTLINRVSRIISFKEQLSDDFYNPPADIQWEKHQKSADKLIRASITVVRDRAKILPLNGCETKSVLHVILTVPGFKKQSLLRDFSAELGKHCNSVDEWIDPGKFRMVEAVENKSYSLIICSLGNEYNFGTNVIRFHGVQSRNLMGGWTHLGTPVLFISHYHPFTHLEYRAVMDTVINTNGTVPAALPVLAEMICGKRALNRRTAVKKNNDWTLRKWLNDQL